MAKRVQDQTHEEWLRAHENHIPNVRTASVPTSTRIVPPTAFYQYQGYSTRKDKLGKGRLVLELVSNDTGEIVNVFFNVNIQYQRGKLKGRHFRTGENGRFWILPKSKFAKFWIEAIGRPERFSTLYRQMGRLKRLRFTGQLDIRPTYKQLTNLKRAPNQ